MALLPTTGLENHPVGATGLNGILNANWERLEAAFLPLVGSNHATHLSWDPATKKFLVRPGSSTLGFAGSLAIDFSGAMVQRVPITGDITFTSSNLLAGSETKVVIENDGSPHNLNFPGGWRFVGSSPSSIAANKTGLLELLCTTGTDAGVIAKWAVMS